MGENGETDTDRAAGCRSLAQTRERGWAYRYLGTRIRVSGPAHFNPSTHHAQGVKNSSGEALDCLHGGRGVGGAGKACSGAG